MTNNCKQFEEDPKRIAKFDYDHHSCWVCRWRSHDNPNQCTPPGYGFCRTEDKHESPKIISSNIELIILDREIRDGPRIGNIHRVISCCPDGSIFVKEMFVDPSTIMFHKKILSSELFDNFYEFSKKYPGDTSLIHYYFLERGIHMYQWLGRGYD